MANFTSIGPKLLGSGAYSDLRLVCENQEFQGHKAIVCSQSSVLEAALKGDFKEAKTNTFHVVDFEPTAVKCMLDYMYTGKYEQAPPSRCSSKSDQENGRHTSAKSDIEIWVHHGLVNSIADYFCLPELARMATATLDGLIQKDWSEDVFSEFLHRLHGRTGDMAFCKMLAKRAADHVGELIGRGLFNGVDPPSDDLTSLVLKLRVQKLDALNARASQHERNMDTIISFSDSQTSMGFALAILPILALVALRALLNELRDIQTVATEFAVSIADMTGRLSTRPKRSIHTARR